MANLGERRFGSNRRRTHVEAVLNHDGGSAAAVVLDVSRMGLRVSVSEPLEPGMALRVDLLDTSVPAIVHWYHGRQAGLRLAGRLDRDTLVALETADDDLAAFR